MLINDETEYSEEVHDDEIIEDQQVNPNIRLPSSSKIHPRNTQIGTGTFGGTRKLNVPEAGPLYPY